MKRLIRLFVYHREQAKLLNTLLIVVLLGALSVAQADPVAILMLTLANGDHVSGRFVAATADRLEIETTYAGRISVRVSEIKSWQTSDEKLRKQVSTSLASKVGNRPNPVEAKKVTASPSRSAKTDSWQRSVNLAYTLARGNVNSSDLNLAFGLSRKRSASRVAFNSLGRYGVRNGAQIAHLFTTLLRYERTANKVPTFVETVFEVDRIKKLDYRFSESIGLSYPAMKKETQTLNFDFGTGVTREVFSTGIERTTATSLLRAAATQKINKKAQLSQQLTFSSDLLNPSEYRMQTDVSLTMPITKFVALKLSGFNRFDNRPQTNVKQNDFSLLTGFSFNF
jgi:putative salt-induced outer membrane protein YdiY